ncbi:MAG: two-component regulator propeller domain-containing protein [Flavobacteriales bacterium]|nr:two-component regulator propeller domain-containing protein [Flavobacteriales bacterium]
MKKLLFLLFPLFIQAQDVPIGFWKDYQSYTNTSYITQAKSKIYCVTNGGLFYLNRDDNTLNRLSKVSGLSDIGVKKIAYYDSSETTIITYENCNIDLIKEGRIINISDIKRKEIIGNKLINNITIKKGIAYLSCTFGLVLLDLEKEEIKDTYRIGENGNFVGINSCAFNEQNIFVASEDGIYSADIHSTSLFDFNSWELDTNRTENYWNIFSIGDSIWTGDSNSFYNNNLLFIANNDTVLIYENLLTNPDTLIDNKLKYIQYIYHDIEENTWIADSENGLLQFINFNYQGNFIPEGPTINDTYSLEYENNTLYMCHGGHINFSSQGKIYDGVSIRKNYDEWINYNYTAIGIDVLEVAVKNGTEYYASWRDGLSEIKNGELVIRYDNDNTNGALETTGSSNNRIKISDLKFDDNGNLWGLNSEVNHPLFVKTKDNEWFSFGMNQDRLGLFFDDLIIDQYNQKWGILGRGGLFVYNDNNTISDANDDQYKILKNSVGQGNLPSMGVYSIAEDLDGEIWVGTDKGIGIFYNPSAIFSGNNFDAQQVLIQEGDYGQYLLSEEKIKCITIDGANRKWIGTEKTGVFLISEDGMEEIQHFTAENSPLFSNNIYDITINPENGEVFIGTEKGLISYRSDATTGVKTQEETHVFPNPVRETYNGPIAINGLITNANIKITDIDGNLVFEDFAKGGQAIWNGKNKNGERASTGVYLVFSTDINGLEKMVSKILFVK